MGDDVTLTLFDIMGVQDYVFSSNVLKENIGGSWLVRKSLEVWLPETCPPQSRILFSGGGNALTQSADDVAARDWAGHLSRMLYDWAPGLRIACVHVPWDGDDASFSNVYQDAQTRLARAKAAALPPRSFDGLGITAFCQSTGEPAIRKDDSRWVGATAAARLDAADEAQAALKIRIPIGVLNGAPLQYTSNLNELGGTLHDRTLLGIVLFDGNSIGSRFERAAKAGPRAINDLAKRVDTAGEATLRGTTQWLERMLPQFTLPESGGLTLHENTFPMRPILYGGDDIALVCDGRIALDVAAELLNQWQVHTRELPEGPAHACAGVALVRWHYPFFRAHELAKGALMRAKRYVRASVQAGSCLDWILVNGGGLVDFENLEARTTGANSLSARPYWVSQPPPTERYRSWDFFRNTLLRELQQDDSDARTQYRKLVEVLRYGPESAREFFVRQRQRFKRDLPQPVGQSHDNGFYGNVTPYVDALELMDRTLPLLEPK